VCCTMICRESTQNMRDRERSIRHEFKQIRKIPDPMEQCQENYVVLMSLKDVRDKKRTSSPSLEQSLDKRQKVDYALEEVIADLDKEDDVTAELAKFYD